MSIQRPSQTNCLTLHIGLPKTATTKLQRDVFPTFPGYICGSESIGLSGHFSDQFEQLFFDANGHRNFESGTWASEASVLVSRVKRAEGEPIFLSLERLFRWHDPKTGLGWPFLGEDFAGDPHRRGAHPVIKFIDFLQRSVPHIQIRVVITLRNQADFMASLYAQVSKALVNPSQDDFEVKVRNFLGRQEPFFDWHDTVDRLTKVLGRKNVRVLLFESGFNALSHDFAEFLAVDVTPNWSMSRVKEKRLKQAWVIDAHPSRTARKILRSAWPIGTAPNLRKRVTPVVSGIVRLTRSSSSRKSGAIQMSQELRNEILDTYLECNRQLCDFTPYGLEQFGYFPSKESTERV